MKIELRPDLSTPNPDEVAVMAARGDYMGESLVGKTVEDAMDGTDQSMRSFIEQLLNRGHFGPFEHAQAYFAVEGISRVAMAQITRHRHMSFDVQSQRYCNFSEKEMVIPPGDKLNPEAAEVELGDVTGADAMEYHFKESIILYDRLIEAGMAAEDARFILPVGIKVDLTFSANSRTLMHFFELRNNMKAQWEAREFAGKVLDECMEWAPLTFEAYEKCLNNNSLRAP